MLLIVDDNPIDLELSSVVLGRHYGIITADSGKHGLLRLAEAGLESKLPDGILSDFEMPEFDGDIFLEIVRGVRSPQDTAARYFGGDRRGIDAIHAGFHQSLGASARPMMLYSSGVDLAPYLSRGANGVFDKDLVRKSFNALVEMVATHLPYDQKAVTVVPAPHQFLAAERRRDSGLLEIPPVGAERPYDRK